MIKRILIVNRGEIAVRIIRACREAGITSIAVFSDADKNSLYTRLADESYHLQGTAASDTYLNISNIISLAVEIQADAIHPGYGFLSENATFIEAVEKAGIIFIGPSAESVKMMGSKTAARALMQKNGVPIVPGTTEPVSSVEEGKVIAGQIGYPVLLKASAGGGGKGMRKVFEESEFSENFLSASREALKAFGNDAVYIEKLILNPKHIEVQIIADKHGNYTHLFERECSVQRRHQKIIEEAPSSFVDEETRHRITSAAVNAAKACGYYNAGTIEFLMDNNKNFYFLEMNTRLQVEHPVTEMITGIDLVQEQINIAQGGVLSFLGRELRINGHAIECRVNSEDPDNNFLPATGVIRYHRKPSGAGVRIDEGVDAGSEVTIHYDSLLTKVITHSNSRSKAINKMLAVLKEYYIDGVQTNIGLLQWILRSERFRSGDYSINFVEDEFLPLVPNKWSVEMKESLSDIATLAAVLLKQNNNNTSTKTNRQELQSENRWERLKYE